MPRRPRLSPPPVAPALDRSAALVIFAAALALRLAYTFSIRGTYFFQHLQVNAERYHDWALAILRGAGAPRPPFEQPPGYPYIVALVYAVAGAQPLAVVLVQAVLGAATCVLIAAATAAVFGRRAAIAAGALGAAYGPFIYFGGELLPETLFVLLAAAAVAAALSASPRRWLLSGCLWAATLLVRSNAVLAFPLALLDARLRGGAAALRRAAAPLVVAIAGFALLNIFAGGSPVALTTSGGLNLWLGNNPHADGVNPFVYGPLEPVADWVRSQAKSAVEADGLFRARARRFWAEQPAAALALAWKKFLWTWTSRELPNNSDIEWKRAHSWLFRLPLLPLGFGFILPLACAGAVLGWAQRRQLLAFLPLLGAGLGTCVIFFTNARFRLVLAPALLPLAAAALERAPALLRHWRQRRSTLAAAGAATAVGIVLAWGGFYGVDRYAIPQIAVNTGISERQAGHFAEAAAQLRRGLALYPGDPIGWIHLALALEQGGDASGAGRAYLDGLAQNPDDPQLREMASRFARRHGLDLKEEGEEEEKGM